MFWSDHRWVAIRIPSGAKSVSYRWGRAVAHVNGDSVKVQHGKIMGEFQSAPSMSDYYQGSTLPKWRVGGAGRTRLALVLSHARS